LSSNESLGKLAAVKCVGLTGGIASGKSTVAGILRDRGAPVIDADAVYHELIRPHAGRPSALARRIGARFAGVVDPDSGAVDRRRLGQRVYVDAAERAELEALTHPAVAAAVGRRLAALQRQGTTVALYEVPLLFEKGLDAGLDGTVLVWVPMQEQVRRLCRRDGLSEAEAHQRLAAQMPLDAKRARATWVIDNSGSLQQTAEQAQHVWTLLAGGEMVNTR
jgi:dephospho-CoA kinase